MNRVVKNASWLIGCRLVQSVLSLVVSMMSARYLGPSNYGLINYATSLGAFILPFMTLGFTNTLVQELIANPEDEGKTLGTALMTCSITSVFSMIVMILFVSVFNATENDTKIVVALYSISILAQALEMIQYWFQAKLLSKYTAVISLVSYVLVSVYKIFLLATGKSVYWFAFSYALDYLLIAVLLIAYYKKLGGQKFSFSFTRVKEMFNKSRYYIISSLMVTLFTQTDKIMLKFMLDEQAVGLYSAAVVCAGLTSFVFAAIIDSFRPVIFQSKKQGDRAFEQSMVKLYSIIIYLSLMQCVALTLFARFTIWITYGETYYQAAPTLQIAVWYTTFSYLGTVRNVWILAESKQRYLWIINLIGALGNVVLNAALIPIMGINGAALASLLTQMFANVGMGFIMKPIRQNNHLILRALNPRIVWEMVKQIKEGIKV